VSEHVNDCDCCQRKLAALRIAGTIDGIHLRQRDAYRDVLRDLIAELRDEHAREDAAICDECVDTYEAGEMCPRLTAADRAEARLREIEGEHR